jgi:hypothetical protein
MAIRFCTVAPNIYGFSVRNLLHVTFMAPGILRWLLDSTKNLCASAADVVGSCTGRALSRVFLLPHLIFWIHIELFPAYRICAVPSLILLKIVPFFRNLWPEKKWIAHHCVTWCIKWHISQLQMLVPQYANEWKVSAMDISVTWLITMGGKSDRGYWELYLTKESNLKEGKNWSPNRKFFILFFLSIIYLQLVNSVTK